MPKFEKDSKIIFTPEIKKLLNPKKSTAMAIRSRKGDATMEFFKDSVCHTMIDVPVKFVDHCGRANKQPLVEGSWFFHESIFDFTESTMTSVIKMMHKGHKFTFEIIRNGSMNDDGSIKETWIEAFIIVHRGGDKLRFKVGRDTDRVRNF